MVAGSTQRKQRPSGFPAVPDRQFRQVLLARSFANVLRGRTGHSGLPENSGRAFRVF
jgi:hypothetical protein